ncbi:MAG TPA: hypothetical protein VLR52_00905, partial [Bacteroidales bacterium]|nr:hypothetical protein [Bacteroidales bacterium]
MKSRSNAGKWTRRILAGLVVLLLVFVATVYLLQHFYGEKWVKQYVQHAILKESDSLYSIQMDDLSINMMTGRLTIEGFKLIPDTNVYYKLKKRGHVPPFLLSVTVSNFKVRGFAWIKVLRYRDVSIEKILISEPEVELIRMSLPDTLITDTTRVAMSLSLPLPTGLNSVVVNQFRITKGKFTYLDRTRSPLMRIVCPELAMEVTNFIQNKGYHFTGRIFNSDDISATMQGFSINLPDSLYHFSLGSIGISTKSRSVSLDSVILTPRYPRKAFFSKLGYQSDMFDLRIGHIGIESIDYPSTLLNNIFHTGYLAIDGWKVDVYRDKRIPVKPGYRAVLPQAALRKINALFTIDSLSMTNGYGSYSEQVGPEPGTVFFNQIKVLAKNVSNDSVIAIRRIMEI